MKIRKLMRMALIWLVLPTAAFSFGPVAKGGNWILNGPTFDISFGTTTLVSGGTTSVSISNWQDSQTWVNDEGGQSTDPIYMNPATVQWSLTGAATIAPSGPGTAILTASSPDTDSTVTVGVVASDYGSSLGTVGTGSATESVTVLATWVADIQIQDGAFWISATSGTTCVASGTSINFQAVPGPSSSCAWPSGKPEWGGDASGTGSTTSVTFNTLGNRTVTAQSGHTTVTASISVMAFSGTLNAADDFAGRSHTQVGVGELGTLGVVLGSGVNLSDLTPLTWTSSGAAITISNTSANGTANFTASDRGGNVTLTLTDKNGNQAPIAVQVIEPSSTTIRREPGTGVWHQNNTGSVGFKGLWYVHPDNVSFANLTVSEGTCTGVATDYLNTIGKNGEPHHPGDPLDGSSPSNNPSGVTGTPFAGDDTIASGTYATTPYTPGGSFTWQIPHFFQVGTGAVKQFTTLTHQELITSSGSMSISKGTHSESKNWGDGTTGY